MLRQWLTCPWVKIQPLKCILKRVNSPTNQTEIGTKTVLTAAKHAMRRFTGRAFSPRRLTPPSRLVGQESLRQSLQVLAGEALARQRGVPRVAAELHRVDHVNLPWALVRRPVDLVCLRSPKNQKHKKPFMMRTFVSLQRGQCDRTFRDLLTKARLVCVTIDLEAQQLQREDCRAIPHVSVDHVRLHTEHPRGVGHGTRAPRYRRRVVEPAKRVPQDTKPGLLSSPECSLSHLVWAPLC